MKQLFLIAAAALLMSTPVNAETVNPKCTHVHDEFCGFNELTNEGCTHSCCDEITVFYGPGCEWCPDA